MFTMKRPPLWRSVLILQIKHKLYITKLTKCNLLRSGGKDLLYFKDEKYYYCQE